MARKEAGGGEDLGGGKSLLTPNSWERAAWFICSDMAFKGDTDNGDFEGGGSFSELVG